MASYENNQKAPDINTGYPGHIYNFDPDSQTCEVQLAIESLFVGMANAYIIEKKKRLKKVTVQFIQGGGWSLTHPIPDGTPCYVHFAQRGIQHWVAENKDEAGFVNGKPAPQFSQLFSHNSATCTIGNQPIPKAIPNFQTSVFELRNSDRSMRVTLSEGAITILAGTSTIVINKSGDIVATSETEATVKAPTINLDGDTTVTKTLTVIGATTLNGGMSVSGGTGSTATFTGNFVHNGSYTLNGIQVDGHDHMGNGAGNDTGPMK